MKKLWNQFFDYIPVIILGVVIITICIAAFFVKGPAYRIDGNPIYLIEGCEYIRFDKSLTHKGNCTNSIHQSK